MRVLLVLPAALVLTVTSTARELYLSGENRLEYWRWKGSQDEFFEDKLDLEAIYGDLLAGLRYYLFQSSQVNDSKRREGISRMFLEWQRDPFQIRAGNYYSVFGRGLVLAAYEDDEVKLDQDLKGFKGSVSLPKFDLTILSGRPRNTFNYGTINDTTDLIRGADLNVRPISFASLGIGWVRFNQLDRMPPPPDTSRRTELYGGRGEFVWNWFNLYGEYAKKEGWDRLLFADGKGEGYYLSSSLSFSGLGLSLEYSDYDSLAYGGFNYRYNNPPCPNRYGKAINNGVDEKGYQVAANMTPWAPLLTGASYAELKTHDDTSHAIREAYGECKFESFEIGAVKLSVDHLKETLNGLIFAEKATTTPLLESYCHITWRHTIGCSYRHRTISDSTQIGKDEWQERRVVLSYSYAPHMTLSLTGEDTGKEPGPGEDTSWRSATLELKLGESHDISLTVGSQKGEDLICSGGVCRRDPPFKGWKITVSSRF